ncbi:MAG TPA: ABC transporter permease [Thermoanaerobaculia bacterium]|nr:ABC transporter permease [Thermoanaerobaculia bacterium]
MIEILQDLRQATRTLSRSPGLTAAAVLTLALGIGASSGIAAIVKGVLLRPLPYSAADRIVMIWSRWRDFDKTWVSEAEARTYRLQAAGFADIALFTQDSVNLAGDQAPERVAGAAVTPNLLGVLGVQPLLGRGFTAYEGRSGRGQVVLLAEGLWRRRFGADRHLIGSAIEVNGERKTVVGVMPQDFKLPLDFNTEAPSEVWWPLAPEKEGAGMPPNGGSHGYYAVGRLRAGITAQAAGAQLRAIAGRLTSEGIYARDWHFQPLVVPVFDEILGSLRRALTVLMVAVGSLILIACGNVANLLLAHGNGRRKEFALRVALGARRGSLVRRLLAESFVLAALGGIGGLGLAFLGVKGLLVLHPEAIPRLEEVQLDGGIATFAFLLSGLTACLFGILPALRLSNVQMRESIAGGRSLGQSRTLRQLQGMLVAAEVALSLVLVLAAGLMIRSVSGLLRVDTGLRVENVLTARLALPASSYAGAAAVAGFYDRLLARLRVLPGIAAAGAARYLPLASQLGDWGLVVEGYQPPPSQNARGDWQAVTPGYFEAMGMALRGGRFFTLADGAANAPVIVISEAMARKFWPGRNALGRRIQVGIGRRSPWSTVVGIVGEVRHNGITAAGSGILYLPQAQAAASLGFAPSEMTLVLKTNRDPGRLIPPLRAVIRKLDPKLPLGEVRTLEAVFSGAVSVSRFTMLFLIACSLLALTLAAVGVYAVVGYAVGLRTQEIGVRMALGARRWQVVALVVRQGLGWIGLGLLAGCATALGATRLLVGLLYGVGERDPLTFAGVAGVLLMVALAASFLPARRAAGVNPVSALNHS